MAEFHNFEVTVGKGGPVGYQARASSSYLTPHDFPPPFQEGELDRLLAQAGVFRDLGAAEESPADSLRDLGTRLFKEVFGGAVGRDWDVFQGKALQSNGKIRLCLLLEDPELWEWPWEYLCDPEGDYLVLSRVSIVRCPAPLQPAPYRKVEPLPRILALSAHPRATVPLSSGPELEALVASLAGLVNAGRIEVTPIGRATLSLLRRELERPLDVLHFIGHGDFGRRRREGVLLFEKENGERSEVSGKGLARILRKQERLPRLIFLNACEGGRPGKADPFAGVAQRLAREGVSAVVAMQFKIQDRAALIFAEAFYEAFSKGESVDCAVYEGRLALYSKGFEPEWGNPVLYMRFSDERIVPPPRKKRLMVAVLVACTLVVLAVQNRDETEPDKAPATDGIVTKGPEAGPIRVVSTPPAPQPPNGDVGAEIEILRATLLANRQLEVWGEVHLEERSDQETFQARLPSLQVEVRLDSGARAQTMIDAQLGTWKVCLKPRSPPKAGERLTVEAVLFGERGRRRLDEVRATIIVESSATPS